MKQKDYANPEYQVNSILYQRRLDAGEILAEKEICKDSDDEEGLNSDQVLKEPTILPLSVDASSQLKRMCNSADTGVMCLLQMGSVYTRAKTQELLLTEEIFKCAVHNRMTHNFTSVKMHSHWMFCVEGFF
jgi:hypothetical protein